MKLRLIFVSIILMLGALFASCGESKPQRELLSLRRATLEKVKKEIKKNDPAVMPAYEALLKEADAILKQPLHSVMEKPQTPPSGDKHDYVSRGTYWWPNPDTPDGLPYIRKDGLTNPENSDFTDCIYLQRLNNDVYTLGLAYYFSGDEKYAAKAAEMLKVWYLNEDTKMNPHLRYGQQIPGICDGRCIGIIDTRIGAKMLNGVMLLEGSESWTQEDDMALQQWFADFNDWLLNDPIGIEEGKQHNNHGTYYDVQVAAFAIYSGKPEIARQQIEKASFKRLDSQLAPDGEQPHEMDRTRPWAYCCMNLMGFTELAMLADRVGIDMWNYQTPNGSSIRKAVEWYFPILSKEKPWPKDEINSKYGSGTLLTAIAMSQEYDPEEYARQIGNMKNFTNDGYDFETSVINLTYPYKR